MGSSGSFWVTPHQIYLDLAGGPGSAQLDGAQAAARFIWAEEERRAELIRDQANRIQGGWQGAASDGAYGAAQPLATSALSGADLVSQSEDLLDRQSGSFHRAANSVVPVPENPPEMDITDMMLPFSDFEKDVTTYQADAQHNIEVYRGYDNASVYNETNIPQDYTITSHSGGTINVVPAGTQPGDTGDFITVPDPQQPRAGDVTGPSGETHNPGSQPIGGPPAAVSDPPPAARQPQQTSPNDFVPPSTTTPSFLPPSTVQPAPPGPGPGLVAGLPVGGFPGSGPGSGTGGPGARGGTYGSPGGGPGAGGSGPGTRGGVLGAGPGTGAIAAEEAAARRAAAAAAARGTAPGTMGGAPVGAGRGKGDEDEEHQRKVLLEEDAEGIFGTDVLTAPQVIGDDAYEDD